MVEAAREHDGLPIRGFRGTPEEIERQWYEQIHRGRGDRIAQLTWRAVIMGSVLAEEFTFVRTLLQRDRSEAQALNENEARSNLL